jgi:hypothetical protein
MLPSSTIAVVMRAKEPKNPRKAVLKDGASDDWGRTALVMGRSLI